MLYQRIHTDLGYPCLIYKDNVLQLPAEGEILTKATPCKLNWQAYSWIQNAMRSEVHELSSLNHKVVSKQNCMQYCLWH